MKIIFWSGTVLKGRSFRKVENHCFRRKQAEAALLNSGCLWYFIFCCMQLSPANPAKTSGLGTN